MSSSFLNRSSFNSRLSWALDFVANGQRTGCCTSVEQVGLSRGSGCAILCKRSSSRLCDWLRLDTRTKFAWFENVSPPLQKGQRTAWNKRPLEVFTKLALNLLFDFVARVTFGSRKPERRWHKRFPAANEFANVWHIWQEAVWHHSWALLSITG